MLDRRSVIVTAAWVAAWGLLTSQSCVPYGVNIAPPANQTPVAIQPEQAQRAAEANLRWARIFCGWHNVQPDSVTEPQRFTTFDWSSCDLNVNAARAKGLTVLLVLNGTAQFARITGTPPRTCAGAKPHTLPPRYLPASAEPYFYTFTRAAALFFGDRVAAYELWNEPDQCVRWQGTAGDYRNLILGPGWDGIHSAGVPQPLIVAPAATTGGNIQDTLDNYLTNPLQPGETVRHLTRPIDIVSVHMYDSLAQIKNRADVVNGYCRCFSGECFVDGSGCAQGFWVTEFGFGSASAFGDVCDGGATTSNPGDAIVNFLQYCDGTLSACNRAFVFTLDDWWWWYGYTNFNATCDLGLLNFNFTPRGKYCTIEQALSGAQVCPCPIGQCP
jgi:hypothetical protein